MTPSPWNQHGRSLPALVPHINGKSTVTKATRAGDTMTYEFARKDGTNASKAVWAYLQTKQPVEPNLKAVTEKMKSLNKPVVTKEDVKKLEAVEIAEAQKRGVEEFKFDTNEEMLQAIGLAEIV